MRVRATILTLIVACTAFAMQALNNGTYIDSPPAQAQIVDAFSDTSFRQYLDGCTIDAIEGVWHYPDDGTTLAITRMNDSRFASKFTHQILLLDAENDRSAIPGTVVGYLVETAQPNCYYVWLYSRSDGDFFSHPVKCTATLNEDDEIIIFSKPEFKLRVRFNLTRLLPTLLKGISVSVEPTNTKHPLGFRKIYPKNNSTETSNTIYL